jgi:hypothetical protein
MLHSSCLPRPFQHLYPFIQKTASGRNKILVMRLMEEFGDMVKK